ncbi:MAG: hypothetical protein B7Y25_03940 [Alphaproteobacteria bacterium 16-39-46]|nr:MAG: hypothetical protein B7Y25_03940 [Alphaproteobacteria bacterium 16-39-46]OZA43125.1 MAG: hypothetical protein B7X84_04035 [Alphaproteobacteria bacterium 17-39-52]HQS84026.1 hypothetical protein [Alphaproteobacteria bacterium]HQS93631.1 hypothetical protein [Alphaproteobacteria bacterium]
MSQKTESSYDILHFLILFGLALLSIVFLWPGKMSPDSMTIYGLAMGGNYRSEWGPLLQFIWRGADFLIKGPALMLILEMAFFWGAVALMAQQFLRSKWFWWFPLLFLYPSILISMGFIWKDLYFTFGYMLASGYLTKKTFEKTPLSGKEYFFLMVLLFFATSVKYQAQFVLFFMMGWILYLSPRLSSFKKGLYALILTAVMLLSIDIFHEKIMCDKTEETYSWQKVKIYDLAGITVRSGDNVIPPFLFNGPDGTKDQIKAKYSHLWEPLITEADSPLRFTKNEDERRELIGAWRQAVLKHPFAYLSHRSVVLYKTLAGSDVKSPLRLFLKAHRLPTWPANMTIIFSYIFGLPLSLFYIWLSLKVRKGTPAAVPLFVLNAMAVTYALFLFVFSLASTSRYVYFCVTCLAFSHPFAYLCWRKRKERDSDAVITDARGKK